MTNRIPRRRTATRRVVSVALAATMPLGAISLGPSAHAADVTRYGGEDRVATAISVFENNPEVFTSDTVIITRSDDYADALTATPLAAALKAPVLTTGPDGIDPRVLESLKKSGTIKNVIVIGGPKAISAEAEAQLAATFATERIAGETRYDTAVKIADKVMAVKGTDSVPVFVATGTNFPDALAAGAAAAAKGAVVLLSQGQHLSPEAAAFINSPKASSITAIGGPAGQAMNSAGVVGQIIIGEDRYDTAAKLAAQVYPDPERVVIASGETYADSLVGAALAAITGAPMLLTAAGSLPATTRAYIDTAKPEIAVLGGTAAIPAAIAQDIATTVGGVVKDGAEPRPTPTPSASPSPSATPSPSSSSTPRPTPSSTPQPTTPAPQPGGGATRPPGTPATPTSIKWTTDLPATTSAWDDDYYEIAPKTNLDPATHSGEVQYQLWTKRPDEKTFTANTPTEWSSWLFGANTSDQGAQYYVTAVWKGQSIRTATTTVDIVTADKAPNAIDSRLTLESPADIVTDQAYPIVSATATAGNATTANGTVSFLLEYEDEQGRSYSSQNGVGTHNTWTSEYLSAPVPGTYALRARFRPADPYKYKTFTTELQTFTVTEKPDGRLKDITVTVADVPEGVETKTMTFSAEVKDKGAPVTTGAVSFWAGRNHLCNDWDGSDGWSCDATAYTGLNGKQLRAQYIGTVTDYRDQPTRFSSPKPLKVRDFKTQYTLDGKTPVVPDPVDIGAETTPLSVNGQPVKLAATEGVELGDVVSVGRPSHHGYGRNYPTSPTAPVITVDSYSHQVFVSAPPGTTPGIWSTHAEIKVGEHYRRWFPVTVEVLPEGNVIDTRDSGPGISYRVGEDGERTDPSVYLPPIPGTTWTVDDTDYPSASTNWGDIPWTGPVAVSLKPRTAAVTLNGPIAWNVYGEDPPNQPAWLEEPQIVNDGGENDGKLQLRRPYNAAWQVGNATYTSDDFTSADYLYVNPPADDLVTAIADSGYSITGAYKWAFLKQ